MNNLVVVGCQWGDEGKGKLVDYLGEKADIIVRFQGGNNAGHTIVIEKKKIALSLIPSGIIRKGTLSVIGNCVVVNPKALLDEIKSLLSTKGETKINLVIREKNQQAHFTLQENRKFDLNQLKALKAMKYVEKITV